MYLFYIRINLLLYLFYLKDKTFLCIKYNYKYIVFIAKSINILFNNLILKVLVSFL